MAVPQELTGQLGRYRIVRRIGEGGMGAVYLAEDDRIGRQVALKVPRFDSSASTIMRERFQREARIAAGIQHPNLCPVHDVDCVDGVDFFTMPFIEGTPLSDLINPIEPWPAEKAADLVRKLALAVGMLHRNDIVHRDLKPANVIVSPTGEPILMDFGLARVLSDGNPLTASGVILGTPQYMSPEQVNDTRAVGPPADVYGLGMILYELVTAQLPFRGPHVQVFGQILSNVPPPPSSLRAGIDPRVDAFCLKALSKKPEDRWRTVDGFIAALDELMGTSPDRSFTMLPGWSHSPDSSSASIETAEYPKGAAAPSRRRTPRWIAGGVFAAVAIGLLIWAVNRPENVGGDTNPVVSPPPSKPPEPRLILAEETTLRQGEAAAVRVRIDRDGLIGPIDVSSLAAVDGIVIGKATIEDGSNEVVLNLSATKTATPGVRSLRLRASSGNTTAEADLKIKLTSPVTIASDLINSLGMPMVRIRPGKFTMGSPNAETEEMFDEERPRHEVEIAQPFLMSATEVTRGQFRAFVTASKPEYVTEAETQKDAETWIRNKYTFEDDQPVIYVSWNDATAFCAWLSNKEKKHYDLPTEAEWEYACRAGTSTPFHFGTKLNGTQANCDGKQPFGTSETGPSLGAPTRTAQYPPNAWGLFDMHGNVREWCRDGMRKYPTPPGEMVVDPKGTLLRERRSLRGGGWDTDAVYCRSAARVQKEKSLRGPNVGFRVVCRTP